MVPDKDNLRMVIWGTDLERTLKYMELLEEQELDDEVHSVLQLLGSCLPEGTRREELGASFKQMGYLSYLAGFDVEQAHEFCRLIREAGGMDSSQAHHLIKHLKKEDAQKGV